MKTQEKVENALRQIHVLFARSESMPGEDNKIIVDKNALFKALEEINRCMYDMMDEYEITAQSHERAIRKTREQGDKLIDESTRVAEDIYSAAILYTDEALGGIFDSINKTKAQMAQLVQQLSDGLDAKMKTVLEDHNELKEQLMEMSESDKYIKLIEQENKKRRPDSKMSVETEVYEHRDPYTPMSFDTAWRSEPVRIMAPTPEIKVDPAYAEEAMLDEFEEGVVTNSMPEVKVNLDSAYFKMKMQEAGITDDDFEEGVIEK